MMHPEWHVDHPNNKKSPDTNYIRSSLIMQIGWINQKITRTDYESAMRFIDIALLAHPMFVENTKYADELYPIKAIKILQLSRTKHWPGYDIDIILERHLGDWLQAKAEANGIEEYGGCLLQALRELECLEGVYLRLNHDAVVDPDVSSVKITTHFGTVSHDKQSQKSTSNKVRKRIAAFLQSQHSYTNNINVIYNGLKRVHDTYNLEQSLLSWMGYLVIRAIAGKYDPVITENRLLGQQPPRIAE